GAGFLVTDSHWSSFKVWHRLSPGVPALRNTVLHAASISVPAMSSCDGRWNALFSPARTAYASIQETNSHTPGMKAFSTTVEGRPRGGLAIKLPFDPAAEWGDKDRYHVTGAIDGHKARGNWIEEAKRRETRLTRIAETVATLKAGRRER